MVRSCDFEDSRLEVVNAQRVLNRYKTFQDKHLLSLSTSSLGNGSTLGVVKVQLVMALCTSKYVENLHKP